MRLFSMHVAPSAVCLICALLLPGAAQATLHTISIPVNDMGEVIISGALDLQTDFSADVQFGSNGESRAAMEFLKTGLPDAPLVDASLNYHINALQGNGGTTPSLQFFAYASDGVITSNDFGTGSIAGTTGPLSSGANSLPLDLGPIQSALDSSLPAVGLFAWSQFSDNLRAGIHWNAFPASNQPSLDLTFDINPLGSLSTTPIAEAQATKTAGLWGVTTNPNDVYISKTDFNNGEERAIFEFDTPDIPAGSIVTGARLKLDVRTYSSNTITGDLASVFAHLYAGDGVADLTDAGALSFPFAQSALIDNGDILEIELDRRTVQAAYDAGIDIMGVLLSYAEANNLDANFYTATGVAGSIFETAPVFEVDYAVIDGATPGDANLDNIVNLDDAYILVEAYTGALALGQGDAIWLDGDFDRDGDVDFADAMTLRRHYTGDAAVLGATFADLPEPAAALVLVTLLLPCRRATLLSEAISSS